MKYILFGQGPFLDIKFYCKFNKPSRGVSKSLNYMPTFLFGVSRMPNNYWNSLSQHFKWTTMQFGFYNKILNKKPRIQFCKGHFLQYWSKQLFWPNLTIYPYQHNNLKSRIIPKVSFERYFLNKKNKKITQSRKPTSGMP